MANGGMSLEEFGQTIKAKHPEYGDMPDAEVGNRVLTKFPQYNDMVRPGVPKPPVPAGLTGPSKVNVPGDILAVGNATADLGKGILKGAGSTANNIGHMFYPDVLAKHLTGAPSAEQQESYFKPANTTQAIGKGAEQVGEFMLPGGAEEGGAAKLAEFAPKLGKMASPLAHIATSALSGGAVNAAQGGSPLTGA